MLNKCKTGLVLGSFIAFIHFIRAGMMAITPTGMQKIIDRIFGLHFIQPVYTITQATRGKGILLIIITFAIGYLMGIVFACLRNRFLGKEKIKIVVQSKPAAKAKAKKRK